MNTLAAQLGSTLFGGAGRGAGAAPPPRRAAGRSRAAGIDAPASGGAGGTGSAGGAGSAAPGWGLPGTGRVLRLLALLAAAGALLAGLAAGARWLAASPLFTLRHIEIAGELEHHGAQALRDAVRPRLQGNFLTLDLAQARAAFEAQPWVRRAEVRRVWPDTLRVTVQEHRAAALWEGSAEAGSAAGLERLVNTHGELFDANPGELDDERLPVFSGPAEGAAAALALHGRLAPDYAALGLPLRRIEYSARGSWRLVLGAGARVELGRGTADELAARSLRFTRTLDGVRQRFGAPLQSADLRHPDGYAIRLAGIGTQAPGTAAAARPAPRAAARPAAPANAPTPPGQGAGVAAGR